MKMAPVPAKTCGPGEEEYETLVDRGRMARQGLDRVQWELGDLAAEVVVKYGTESLQEYARAIGLDYGTLLNYRRVSKRFPFSRRREDVSWSHHERAAALTPDAADALLLQAAAEVWSVRRFSAKVEAERIRESWQADRERVNQIVSQRAATPNSSRWANDLAEASRLCEIVRELACMRLSPSEVASLVFGEQAVQLERHLERGHRWLREFVRVRRQRGPGIEEQP
jgi:hypothetical protein